MSQQSVWSIHVSTLLLRSLLEKDSRRSVERAMQQIEVNVLKTTVANFVNLINLFLFLEFS